MIENAAWRINRGDFNVAQLFPDMTLRPHRQELFDDLTNSQ